ncbi:MAG: phytoene/squalene synthase family protein [Flavobacteriales bacterium]
MKNNRQLFDDVSAACSRNTALSYSTSFSLGISTLGKRYRQPVYAIYGFVRFADEIVDTFHSYNKADLLKRFREDTLYAIDNRISMNPILHSFQQAYHQFNLEWPLVDQFLKSMEMDLSDRTYTNEQYNQYIHGSAEVVGMMCLRVFAEGDQHIYEKLKPQAIRLGAAFQKINFLRDMKQDYEELGRNYFPEVDFTNFDSTQKLKIESEIKIDFDEGLKGIKMLPRESRLGVYLAYVYYRVLFNKMVRMPHTHIMHKRVRIPVSRKLALLAQSYVRHSLNLI